MDLTQLASSQAPNAVAGVLVLVAALAALGMRERFRWLYPALGLVFAAAVVAKNLSYNELVVGAEGNLDAHREYAGVMLWVVVAQAAVGVGLMVLAVVASKRLGWLTAVAGLACGYAALCMTGWREAYLVPKAVVQYEVWAPPLHWVILGGLAVAFVMVAVSPLRRRRPTATP